MYFAKAREKKNVFLPSFFSIQIVAKKFFDRDDGVLVKVTVGHHMVQLIKEHAG